MCIDYRKLNNATRKDHFPLPFIDQMLESVAGHAFYYFLDGYSGYNQTIVDPQDQKKTVFNCPFGVFAYRRMPFRLYITNYKAIRFIPKEYTKPQVKKLLHDAKYYLWDEPYVFKRCSDGMIRCCASDEETQQILWHCHGSEYGSHFGEKKHPPWFFRVGSTG
ncbi:uncharacterized protein LOC110273630 [Arachis duranensis]|uniref:Uncharacterized protein LOC110273630 n=1 Tax=Arachis duranensis TaxID=130453 RepID=A0A6P5MI87_ARADU|nr:uncharacterized protein LOC110273630 [Arachis duranensis]